MSCAATHPSAVVASIMIDGNRNKPAKDMIIRDIAMAVQSSAAPV